MLNMFDFVLQQWSRIVQDQLQPNLSPLGALPSLSTESASERDRQTVTGSSSLPLSLPPSLPLSVSAESSLQVLEEGCDVSQGSLRSLSMAVSLFSLLCALQTVQTVQTNNNTATDSKEDAQQRTQSHTQTERAAEELLSLYLSLLQRVRAWSAEHALSQQSFSAQGKQVVVLEGAHVLRETIGLCESRAWTAASSIDIESIHGMTARDFYDLYATHPHEALPLVSESVTRILESSLRTGEEGEGR